MHYKFIQLLLKATLCLSQGSLTRDHSDRDENDHFEEYPVLRNGTMEQSSEPIKSSNHPVTLSNQPMTLSNQPMILPNEPMTSPNEPMTSPNDLMTSPNDLMTSPNDPMTSPNEPMTFPKILVMEHHKEAIDGLSVEVNGEEDEDDGKEGIGIVNILNSQDPLSKS